MNKPNCTPKMYGSSKLLRSNVEPGLRLGCQIGGIGTVDHASVGR